jgi:hypothetical protein
MDASLDVVAQCFVMMNRPTWVVFWSAWRRCKM